MACGGSTNAPIHLIALARRAEIPLGLGDFEDAAGRVPVLLNLMPVGEHLMQDFFQAGGTRALLARIGPFLDGAAPTVAGGTLAGQFQGAEVRDDEVIRPLDRPVSKLPAMAVLRGNLAPEGALIKPASAEPRLLQHRGPALVFEGAADLARRIDDPGLPVSRDSVIVLRNAGPVGAPGMPEWGNLPIPRKLLAQGVRDMLRISDARMSGTHYGACVLHASPEAAIGGPLAMVRNGDPVEIDFPARRLTLCVPEDELACRRATWVAPAPHAGRGYAALYARHVTQAPEGCDFDFLEGRGRVPEPEIY
jgi:dihydroxy-acid dehydratase